ncbi:MAG TPA: hypothetical protein VFT95_18495, partial [Micromonosporaceae bacterium]|nr:hypothetical protein [Micromonosporaceae bacterium]
LDGDTRGNLSGDERYLADVLAVYRVARVEPERFAETRPVGQPRVLWAAHTPAGRAAAVGQRFTLPEEDDATAILVNFFADGRNGRPSAVTGTWNVEGEAETLAFVAGADRSELVVLDPGAPIEVSEGFSYGGGQVVRTGWAEVPAVDGAATRRLAPGRSYTLAVRYANGGEQIRIANAGPARASDLEPGLGWRDPPDGSFPAARPAFFPLGGTPEVSRDAASTVCSAAVAMPLPGEADSWAEVGVDWLAAGRRANGDMVVACDVRVGNDRVRTVAVVVNEGGGGRPPGEAFGVSHVFGNVVDRTAVLPVAVPLPGAAGWVVAKKGAVLRYRLGDGAWTDAGADAALLPPEATAVSVDGREVPLPR